MDWLAGIQIVNLAVNVPGPLAAAQLRRWGAKITKVEPPAGDPLAGSYPAWYQELHQGQEIVRLDLKQKAGRGQLAKILQSADLLLTASRPSTLKRLSLHWDELHLRHPQLCQVAILGHAAPLEERAGHDLTYQARQGLLVPPHLPQLLIADAAGAERVVATAVALLFARHDAHGFYATVVLSEVLESFGASLRHGATTPQGVLGGGHAGYNLYRAKQGWIALAALENHFQQKLMAELKIPRLERDVLQRIFLTRTAVEWEQWADERDIPLAVVSPPQYR